MNVIEIKLREMGFLTNRIEKLSTDLGEVFPRLNELQNVNKFIIGVYPYVFVDGTYYIGLAEIDGKYHMSTVDTYNEIRQTIGDEPLDVYSIMDYITVVDDIITESEMDAEL